MVEAIPADGQGPEPSGQARRSLHENAAAVAAPGQQRATQERPSTVAGPAAKRTRQAAARPAAAQLSMLDATDDAELGTDPEQCP